MTYKSTVHKLFKVPELLVIISKHSEIKHLPRLLRVSRTFFRAAVPLIWEEVTGVHNLLELLPGVEIKVEGTSSHRNGYNGSIKTNVSIVVPPGLTEAIYFTRFDLYAQFVKRLSVSPRATVHYHVAGWRQLSNLAKRRVLLPNLLELTVAPHSLRNYNLFLWIRTFLSPSLTGILVEVGSDDDLPLVSSLVAKSLLGHIEATCYNLQKFQFFPEPAIDRDDTRREVNELSFADFWEPSFFERLGKFRLRKLGCTTEILSSEWIHVLSELSQLNSLELYTVQSNITGSKPASLPYLEHLGIYLASPSGVEKIAKLGLLGGLNSLSMSLRDSESPVVEFWEKNIALLISHNSPKLTKLRLGFEDLYGCMPHMSSFRPLASLPIAEVCLTGTIATDEEDLENLAEIWPSVTRLEICSSDWEVELNELHYFTQLPLLQHLTLFVSGYNNPNSTGPFSPSPALQTFDMANGSIGVVFDVSLVAQYLLSLWPNLQQVRWPGANKAHRPLDTLQSISTVKALNSMIASQRDMTLLKSSIVGEYGLGALDRLLKRGG
ncbi:hypothetical protein FRC07_005719 [Ceratobasidium sp. 392]|nr:hypothetical protein FRC07_005719 [Ceratobasidium sp. 392]